MSDIDEFRGQVSEWIATNLPASLRNDPNAASTPMWTEEQPTPDLVLWTRRMGGRGWGTPTWPKEYGGGGLSAAETRVLREELLRVGARNPIGGNGVVMFGPTLLEYGDEAQKARHLPPIARGEKRWCQGFSEPGAGSDLAGLQTRAEDRGDHFLVNGQKIWTSGANIADWCFCLVRTDPSAKKHEGISFILIDMKTPGVLPRPILLINGTSPFCETFFTDVKVPKENLVGPLNRGWTIAKRLLQHERHGISGGNSAAGADVSADTSLQDLAKTYVGADEAGRLADLDLRGRITQHLMEARAFALTGRRVATEGRSNQGPSAAASIMKNVSARMRQDRGELEVEIMGTRGLGWEGDDFSTTELTTVRAWLRGKTGSIGGGTTEVQNNIIAKRILGLPDATGSV